MPRACEAIANRRERQGCVRAQIKTQPSKQALDAQGVAVVEKTKRGNTRASQGDREVANVESNRKGMWFISAPSIIIVGHGFTFGIHFRVFGISGGRGQFQAVPAIRDFASPTTQLSRGVHTRVYASFTNDRFLFYFNHHKKVKHEIYKNCVDFNDHANITA